MDGEATRQGTFNWRLSSHPITLLFFLFFRIGKASPFSTPSTCTKAPPLKAFSQANTLTSNLCSRRPRLPLRPPLHPKLRPHLHHHRPPPRRRLLLPQEHRRSPARRPALVERGRRAVRGQQLGFRARGARVADRERDR